MAHFTAAGTFRSDNAHAWLTKFGYSPTTSSSWISALCKSGHLRAIGRGTFQFVKPYNSNGAAPEKRND